ncbi:MAG: biotin synthase BioB [Lachnospiraceae bacterium]|nr:biotin synthase BioB [Lachnospiraceae bacterium]
MDVIKLAKEIIDGKRLTRADDLSFFETADLEELAKGADEIREALCKNHVDLCTIINGRAGGCSENCKFCAQSAHSQTGCDRHGIVDPLVVLEDCKKREAAGVHAYSIVTAGRTVEGRDLDTLVEAYNLLNENCNLRLCASHGLITAEAMQRLRDAGVTMYHENIETSKRNFPNICTTHTYEDKIKEIQIAKDAGMSVCSGGIIGMGETFEDRIDMAVSLAELEIDSIPINALIPVPGTPFAELTPLTEDDIIRTIAMFRYINPTAYIRMAAGRNYFSDGGRRVFSSGANATITGDMLTTVGNNTKQDKDMLTEMGFEI